MLIQIAPLAGFLVGVNYWNSTMDDDYDKPCHHTFQICLGVVAIVIYWDTNGGD